MNGAHDLGGMQGFGPIEPEPEAEEPIFHADWERRVLAITLAAGALGQWTLDASRYARENQHPVDYLCHSYYETWMAGLEKLLVERGIVTDEELASGMSTGSAAADMQARKLPADRVAAALAKGSPTMMEGDRPVRFAMGDRVRVRLGITGGHTRAPRYARGRSGTVAMHHGIHIFADKNAHGTKEGQHLYSVRFEAADLWGLEAANRGAVFVDLWDDHLEQA